MKRITLLLSLGFAALSATGTEAADWNNGAGGIKDHGGMAGIPVPAPVPVMESFSWYLRADLGYAVKSSGSATVDTPLGLHQSFDYDTNEGPFFGGVGFGQYVTKNLRWDLTGEYRGLQKVKSGPTSYTGTTFTPDTANAGFTMTNTYAITRSEEVRVANHQFLFNMYYDLNRGGGLNPYIGAGLGLTAREGRVEYTENGVCTSSITDFPGPPPPLSVACTQPDHHKSGRPTNTNFGLAAALMAGVTYEIRQGILLDTGYRLSYQGGNTTIRPAGSGDVISAGERVDHEVRAGLRWNVW